MPILITSPNGTTTRAATLTDALLSVGSKNRKITVTDAITIATTVIPPNITIDTMDDGGIEIPNGQTLTSNGTIRDAKIFGNGNVIFNGPTTYTSNTISTTGAIQFNGIPTILGMYQVCTGGGSVTFGTGTVDKQYGIWTGAANTTLTADIAAAAAAYNARTTALETLTSSGQVHDAANLAGTDGETIITRLGAVETGQSAAVVGYATQALLYADLAPADKSVAYVTNDSTTANNGTYRKSGGSGSGSWIQSSFDRVAVAEANSLRQYKADLTLDGAYFEEDTTNWFVFIKATKFYVRASTADISEPWATISNQLGTSITLATSTLGATNCIKLVHNSVLVWDFTTQKLEILTNKASVANNHLVLATDVFGQVSRGAWMGRRNQYFQSLPFDPQLSVPGVFFNEPLYEKAPTGELYLKPVGWSGGTSVFFIRGGAYSDYSCTYDKIKADLTMASPSHVQLNQTSPSGWTDCIKFNGASALWFNPTTLTFFCGTRVAKKTGWIKLIESAYGYIADCTERPMILYRLLQAQVAADTANLNAVDATIGLAGVDIVAHRGTTAFGAPENTLASITHAAACGYKIIETDINYTSDGQLVLLHDDSLNRTYTNADGTDIIGTVNINAITLSAARAYRARSTAQKYRCPIPTMDECILTCFRKGLTPILEIKALDSALDDVFIASTRKYFRDADVWVHSFDSTILQRLRPKAGYRLGFLDGSVSLAAANLPAFVDPVSTSIDAAYMATAVAAGVDVATWTPTTQTQLNDLARLGVRYIVSDCFGPANPATGLLSAAYATGLNFTGCALVSAVATAGTGTAVIDDGGSVTTTALAVPLQGAVYGSVTLQGNARIDILVDGVIRESITVNVSIPDVFYISKLINSGTVWSIRVVSLSGQVVVHDVQAQSKKLMQ